MDAFLLSLSDPTIWVGLLTLVVLEIVLGIDNLLFIAVLAEKLPPHQRELARKLGLSLALIMRLLLLTAISWMVTLVEPVVTLAGVDFTGRDLILIGGGLFLVFKATMELDERLEGAVHQTSTSKTYAGFWMVISQIVILDAVFSLDAVITAVGMVDELWVMMTAVVIAMAVMIAASRPLTLFVNKHPALVILCLGFLLMIGFTLIADGFGLHIPKGYLYGAIGFSILIEVFNQIGRRKTQRRESKTPLRARTAEAILRMLGSQPTSTGKCGRGDGLNRNNGRDADFPRRRTLHDIRGAQPRGSIGTANHDPQKRHLIYRRRVVTWSNKGASATIHPQPVPDLPRLSRRAFWSGASDGTIQRTGRERGSVYLRQTASTPVRQRQAGWHSGARRPARFRRPTGLCGG